MVSVITASRAGDLSKADKKAIEGWWGDARKKINTIANEKNREAVKSIADTSTRTILTRVMDTNTDEIDRFMEIWELDRLSKKLDKLADNLQGVNGIAVQTIEEIAEGLGKLSESQKKPLEDQKKGKPN